MSMDNLQAVIDVARSGVNPTTVAESNAKKHILIHGHGAHPSRVEILDMEVGLLAPLRKRGMVVVFDAASFNQVIADNKDAGNIAIYFDRNPERPSVVGVLNGNGKDGPGWGDFCVSIQFRPTPQWVRWKKIDGQLLPQAEFAEFVEDNMEDIADPLGAQMLEIATELQTTRTVNFRSAVRLSSGAIQFTHNQDDQAKVGAGAVAVPETFTLGIAPVFGMPSYAVPARFRWRIVEGKLRLGFKLQRVETMMAKIVEDVIAKIERGANISIMDGVVP